MGILAGGETLCKKLVSVVCGCGAVACAPALTPTLEMPDGGVLADFDVGELEGFLRRRGMLPS